jgi:hypothetical protein
MPSAMPIVAIQAPPLPRDGGALSSGAAAPRGESAPTRLISPVPESARSADIRLPLRRDRPVGPPPAFEVSLLQHLMETARAPVPIIAAVGQGDSPGAIMGDPATDVPARSGAHNPHALPAAALPPTDWEGVAPADTAAATRVDFKL